MCTRDELTLSIFSADREPQTSISDARYTIDNGPLYIKSLAVASCTLYNTPTNIRAPHNVINWSAESPSDGAGEFTYTVPPAQYTMAELAAELEAGMLAVMASTLTNNTLAVTHDEMTNRITFTWDTNHDYSSNREYVVVSEGDQFHWTLAAVPEVYTSFPAGLYEINAFATLIQGSMTPHVEATYPGRTLPVSYDFATKKITIQNDLTGSNINFSVFGDTALMVRLGLPPSYDSGNLNGIEFPNPVQLAEPLNLPETSGINTVLNFTSAGSIGEHLWLSGSVNLAGAMLVQFRSRVLNDQNHRTVDNFQDTAFWSMPLTAGWRQLQHYQVSDPVWVTYEGGLELNQLDIAVTDEHGDPLPLANDYVLKLRLKSSQPF